jgi:hypothetical protein
MALFDKSGILVVAVLVATGTAIGWQADQAAAPVMAAANGATSIDRRLVVDAQRLRDWTGASPPAASVLAVRCWSDFLLPPAQVELFDIPAQCLAQAPAQVMRGSITE